MRNLWKPIDQISENERRSLHLLVRAPELVDLDCNLHGVAPGYFQDDRDNPGPDSPEYDETKIHTGGYNGWLAAAYDMQSDEWFAAKVTPTHYLVFEGPAPFTQEELAIKDAAALEDHAYYLKCLAEAEG